MEQVILARVGWWWMIAISVPFALYSIPFVLGSFELYKHLTIAAAAGRHDLAGLHIAKHVAVWQVLDSIALLCYQFMGSFSVRIPAIPHAGDIPLYAPLALPRFQTDETMERILLSSSSCSRLWVHAAVGLAFMIVAPFQFSSSFRARNLQLHRQMGYVFVAASLILASTGSTVMTFNSEFQQLGRTFMAVGGCLQVRAVAMALTAAKQRRILEHRCWMIRAAVIGYAVINVRIVLVILQTLLHIPIFSVADYSIAIFGTLNVACAEFYIQRYLKGVALSKDHKN